MADFGSIKDLTMEEKAVALRNSGSCNCCQSVVGALTEDDLLLRAAAGFGGGMGNMQGSCGALVGAVMAAGVKYDKPEAKRFARQISENFRERCGAVICRDLKGIDTGVVLCPCEECVRNAVKAYLKVTGG